MDGGQKKRKEALIMMIKLEKKTQHMQNTDRKENVPPTQKKVIQQKKQHEKLYILDLSALKEQDEQNVPFFHDETDFLDLSQEAMDKHWGNMMENVRAEQAENEDDSTGELTDNSRRLTRMLVAAKSTMEVQDVLSAAHKDKSELIKAAAFGDERAKAIIRKLDKVIRRGHRKNRDLSKEMQLMQKQQRAEKKEQELIARKAREELKRAQHERKQRERKYLDERDDEDDEDSGPMPTGPSMAATEAKIRALAQAMTDLNSTASTESVDAAASGIEGAAIAGGGDISCDVSGGASGGEVAIS